ncbi:hypothetical protein B484DRAFT_435417 [Ochromonadaceae sp. CCMP2298]|nr:hypothetical protein B484DRAFT_435417 [Ochromonadaceae sp. CCMP2298]
MSGRMMAHQKRPSSVWVLAQYLSNRSRKERSNNQDGTMGTMEAAELVFLNEDVRAFYTNNISLSSYKDMRNQVLRGGGRDGHRNILNSSIRAAQCRSGMNTIFLCGGLSGITRNAAAGSRTDAGC